MKKLNVEEGELIIRNSKGNIAVIPAYDRNKIKSLIEKGCDNCVNEYVSGLPLYSDYAEDGTLLPINDPKEVLIEKEGNVKSYDTSSPEYKEMYNSGKLMSYDKESDTYYAPIIKDDIVITAPRKPSVNGMLKKWEEEHSKNAPDSFLGAIGTGAALFNQSKNKTKQ